VFAPASATKPNLDVTLGPIPVLLLFTLDYRHPALTSRVLAIHGGFNCPPESRCRRRIGCERCVNGDSATMNCTEHAARIRQPLGMPLTFQTWTWFAQ
jgi:hypothetical protein